MKIDNVDKLFDRLQGEFDTQEPTLHHKARFLKKLQEQSQETAVVSLKRRKRSWWKPLTIAASFALVCVLIFTQNTTSETRDLADISPEMEETQDFFTKTIERELYNIQQKANPQTQDLVDDTVVRLKSLEKEYDQLKGDLKESGEDKRVIYAMIANFQNRIALLEDVLERIETIQSLNENLTPSEL